MDISGIIQSYDSRIGPSTTNRVAMTSQYYSQPYPATTSNNLAAPHQHNQQNPFTYNQAYSTTAPNGMMPMNYIQQRPLPRLMQPHPVADAGRGVHLTQNARQSGFVEDHQTRSPCVKQETKWNPSTTSPAFTPNKAKSITSTLPTGNTDISFGTEVDVLMKAIQAKCSTDPPQKISPVIRSRPVMGARLAPHVHPFPQVKIHIKEENELGLSDENVRDDPSSPKDSKKRYRCTIEGCSRSFCQKTHLDIHIRAHTGDKPYECRHPGCGRYFSQLGNLKTHERRHTGDRPFSCDLCGKRFAQRGNVRAHRIVHEQAKPYICRLDGCDKLFTQLGNLKSHQNKFHIPTIRKLTSKFASIKDGDVVNAADKELWEYFANLYKNSNKGIKGRGKDRKVGSHSMARSSSLNIDMRGSEYAMSGSSHGHMDVGMMGAGMGRVRGREGQYEMLDADDESQSGSHNGGGSSAGNSYDDPHSNEYAAHGRSGDLAFGDRIY